MIQDRVVNPDFREVNLQNLGDRAAENLVRRVELLERGVLTLLEQVESAHQQIKETERKYEKLANREALAFGAATGSLTMAATTFFQFSNPCILGGSLGIGVLSSFLVKKYHSGAKRKARDYPDMTQNRNKQTKY